MPLLTYHPDALAALREPSASDPWRVLTSGCLMAWPCGVEGNDYALLLEVGIPVVSQRDFFTLGLLRARLDPSFSPPPEARDHHEHPWTVANLPGPHPRR